jgi:hypothetical protein
MTIRPRDQGSKMPSDVLKIGLLGCGTIAQFVQIPAKCHGFEEHAKAFRVHFSKFLQSLADSSVAPET